MKLNRTITSSAVDYDMYMNVAAAIMTVHVRTDQCLIFKHDELRKTPILDQKGNRIMRDEYFLDGLNCEP